MDGTAAVRFIAMDPHTIRPTPVSQGSIVIMLWPVGRQSPREPAEPSRLRATSLSDPCELP